jgi:hypothetical protein
MLKPSVSLILFPVSVLMAILSYKFYSVTNVVLYKFFAIPLLVLPAVVFLHFKPNRLHFRRIYNKRHLVVYIAVVMLYIISIFRRHGEGMTTLGYVNQVSQIALVTYVTFAFATYIVLITPFLQKAIQRIHISVMSIFMLFIIVNVLTFLIGLKKKAIDPVINEADPVFATLLGLEVHRTSFIFSGSHNTTGVVVGAVFVLIVSTWMYFDELSSKVKIFFVSAIAACFYSFLITDSRGAVLSSILSLLFVGVASKFRLLSLSYILLVLVPFLPILTIHLLSLLSELEIASMMTRNPGDLTSANGRFLIWSGCLQFMSEPDIMHLIGWGQYGHVSSGASKLWAVFYNYATHNFFFQLFFDMGYLGVFFVLCLMGMSIQKSIWLYRKGQSIGLVFLAFNIYYILSGIVLETLTMSIHEYTFMFFILHLCVILVQNEYLRETNQLLNHPA